MKTAEILSNAMKEKRTLLTEIESKQILLTAGFPIVETSLAITKADAIALAVKTGYPVVMKIVSPDISHKSDCGGVILGIQNSTQAGKSYDEILNNVKTHNPAANITGISVQNMAAQGVEVIVGMTKDAQFGPVIMFGLGGIMVEVLKDVSFRLAPMTRHDASEMIREIKGFPVLCGYRGQAPVDLSSLEDIIIKLSNLVDDNPAIKELDLNPIFSYKKGALIADARIILEKHPNIGVKRNTGAPL